MNLLKTLTVGLFAVALPTMASAQTIIHICGSTAFRAPVTCAIINALGNTSCLAASNKSGATTANSNILGGQSGIFANGSVTYSGATYTGSATIIVVTNWTGSLAGVVDVATANTNLVFPDHTSATVNGDGTGASVMKPIFIDGTHIGGGGSFATGFATVAHLPEVCMTDAFVSSAAAAVSTATLSGTVGGATTGAALKTKITGAQLVEAGTSSLIHGAGTAGGYLGIVPFQWVVGNTTPNNAALSITNITQQTANYLIRSGSAPLSMFNTTSTGTLTGDDFVYLVGRNEDSGTRIDAFAEPQLSFTQNPTQYLLVMSGGAQTGDIPAPTDFVNIGGSAGSVKSFDIWPSSATLNTEPLVNWSDVGGGHGGYAGGGDVSSVLSTPVDQASIKSLAAFTPENTGNAYFIGYLGVADCGGFGLATSITNGKALTYNGVTPSVPTIQKGAYSFWSYEHMYYIKSTAPNNPIPAGIKGWVDALANSLASTYVSYNSSGVSDTTVKPAGVALPASGSVGTVSRSVEGGFFSLNY